MPMRGDKVTQYNAIKITGLNEFRAAMQKLGTTGSEAIAKIVSHEAAQLIVTRTKPKIPLGPGRGGHARNTLKVVTNGIISEVEAGGPNFSYYPWLDFGGRVGINQSVRRQRIKGGRYVWATYDDMKPEINKQMESALNAALKEAGLL